MSAQRQHTDLAVVAVLLLLVVHVPRRFLCLAGISESAGVALGMFVVHVFTLTAVCVLSALYAFFNVTILKENLQQVCRLLFVGGGGGGSGGGAAAAVLCSTPYRILLFLSPKPNPMGGKT